MFLVDVGGVRVFFVDCVSKDIMGDLMAAGNDFRHAQIVFIDPTGSWKVMSVM